MVFGTGIIAILSDSISKLIRNRVKGGKNIERRLADLEAEISELHKSRLMQRLESLEDIVLMDKQLEDSSNKRLSAIDYKANSDNISSSDYKKEDEPNDK